MDTRLVAAAIPLFGIFIALEWWVSNKRKVKVYRLFDAIADLSCGISQQLCLLVSQAPLLVLYAYLQQNYAIWTFEKSLGTFAIAWLINDAEYRIVFVDLTFVPILEAIAGGEPRTMILPTKLIVRESA